MQFYCRECVTNRKFAVCRGRTVSTVEWWNVVCSLCCRRINLSSCTASKEVTNKEQTRAWIWPEEDLEHSWGQPTCGPLFAHAVPTACECDIIHFCMQCFWVCKIYVYFWAQESLKFNIWIQSYCSFCIRHINRAKRQIITVFLCAVRYIVFKIFISAALI